MRFYYKKSSSLSSADASLLTIIRLTTQNQKYLKNILFIVLLKAVKKQREDPG